MIPIFKHKQRGSSHNPIVFHDYESFVAKFADLPKTTDDCYTPPDVFEAVVQYVGSVIDLTDKVICRPFYPGGDYETAEYPANGIVIDNPPFSIFKKIVEFYVNRRIPFFLFGPALTIFNVCKICTAVISDSGIKFNNGAVSPCNFATNLFGDIVAMTAPKLHDLIKACVSQNNANPLPKYAYPSEICSVANMQMMCKRGVEFAVKRDECRVICNLDNYPKKHLFGNHLLISSQKAKSKAVLFRPIQYPDALKIELSDREKAMVARLS